MDIKQLRQTLKLKWLSYCQKNRSWLLKIRVWRDYNGVRRPSSGYILATLSALEPCFQDILSIFVELNNDPDQIIRALGLNFNPDEELRLLNLVNHTSSDEIISNSTDDNIAYTDKLLKHDSVATNKNNHGNNQSLLRIVSRVDQKHQSASVVRINKPANQNPSVCKEEKEENLNFTNIKGNRRSPTAKKPIIHHQSFPSPTVVNKCNYGYQFSSLPAQEIAYISSTTNARSLPAWMDEFCPGIR